jgi:hypothetical protein
MLVQKTNLTHWSTLQAIVMPIFFINKKQDIIELQKKKLF